MTVARVLPDVTGLDKHFDYLVPARFADLVEVGTQVRVPLHGRRVGGWVTALDPEPDGVTELKEITGVTGVGPAPEIVELASWAAYRWAGRRRSFLVVASPHRAVRALPSRDRTGRATEPASPATTELLGRPVVPGRMAGGIVRLPPTADPLPSVASALVLGPVLVVAPGADQARLLAVRLRRAGVTVAVVPDEWAAAAGGVDVVVGARTAAWAPCPGLAAAVVIDEHDEALQSEAAPTWHARDVVIERCRRLGVPVVMVSPAPTLHALSVAPLVHPPAARERAGWPIIDVVDRSDEEPWRRSLLTSPLIAQLREPGRRVVCVSNATGRARLLACRSCRALARCERCEAAVALDDDGRLVCGSCGMRRPAACTECRSSAFANLRPGVTRLREELEAASGRPVARVTGMDDDLGDPGIEIHVGTEAVLHRVQSADVVVFLDFDRELLAPRYRAAEQAMSLLVRAARLVGSRRRGGRVMVQTFLPDHELLRAAQLGDPGRLVPHESARRAMLGLPPVRAVAEISGPAAEDFVSTLSGLEIGGGGDRFLVRADTDEQLSAALSLGVRPTGSALRVAVDPPRI